MICSSLQNALNISRKKLLSQLYTLSIIIQYPLLVIFPLMNSSMVLHLIINCYMFLVVFALLNVNLMSTINLSWEPTYVISLVMELSIKAIGIGILFQNIFESHVMLPSGSTKCFPRYLIFKFPILMFCILLIHHVIYFLINLKIHYLRGTYLWLIWWSHTQYSTYSRVRVLSIWFCL